MKREKTNGLSIFFMRPETLRIHRLLFSLVPPLGEDSNLLFNTCEEGLERVKVKENDTFRSVNDDCSTVKRKGRILLCDGDGDEEEQEEIPD